MRLPFPVRTALIALLLAPFIIAHFGARAALQSGNLRFRERNPVVNVQGQNSPGGQITLTVIDANGQPASGVSFESGSPDIASVNPTTGTVTGLQAGFATITARRGSDSVSTFIAVAQVIRRKGVRVPGDTKTDTGGRVYLSDPLKNVILRKDGFDAQPLVFAGREGVGGFSKAAVRRSEALFTGPTAVAVDNGVRGGVYIADTLNHSIRKIDLSDNVTTDLGIGSPGINLNDQTPFDQAKFNGPRGVAVGSGGNLFISDTDNHVVYIADFTARTVRLLAGMPGASGKQDGRGRNARFLRPSGIAVSQDGKSIAVADAGNNRVRLIDIADGTTTTISSSSSSPLAPMSGDSEIEQTTGEIAFNNPQSVSFDDRGNIYVADGNGVQVITVAQNQARQVFLVAQAGSFRRAASVAVNGTDIFVLDGDAINNDEVVRVFVGAPQILNLTSDFDRLEGGSVVVISGKNFAPESVVVLGEKVVEAVIESATRIRFKVPQLGAPGRRTLSILTRGGIAQREFRINAKRFEELADGEITTIAGGVPFIGDNGAAAAGKFKFPQGVVADGAGNIIVADTSNNRVRRIDPSGFIATIAGNGAASFSGDGGLAVTAGLNFPKSIAMDSAGNLFIADIGNNRIRRVDAATGVITTAAGNGQSGFNGDGIPATSAGLSMSLFAGIAVDGAGNLFIPETGNARVRRVDARTGIITTAAGSNIEGFRGDNGPATAASLFAPSGVALDGAGNLFIADSLNSRIRRVDARTQIITTFAGNGQAGFNGDNRPATTASLNLPVSVSSDGLGNILIADLSNNRIRRVNASTGVITTLAGNGSNIFSGDGGAAINAGLNSPAGATTDAAGNMFIADQVNQRIRRVSPNGIITTVAGTALSFGDGGPAINADLGNPTSVALDAPGNIFIADNNNNRVRRIDSATGIITTFAGNGSENFSGDGGPAVAAGIFLPFSIDFDSAGNLLIAEPGSNRIRRIDARTGIITTIAGNGEFGFSGDGGRAVNSSLSAPFGTVFDRIGNNIIIADTFSSLIRLADARGFIFSIAGNLEFGFNGDNRPALGAALGAPIGVALDSSGNLFIADSGNNRIRRVDRITGAITTAAGNGSEGFRGDGGLATNASLSNPTGVAFDAAGNLLIADSGNNRIRRVDVRTRVIQTAVGNGTPGYSGDGDSALNASLNSPKNIAFDRAGNLYIAAGFNDSIRVVKGFSRVSGLGDFTLNVNPPSQTVSVGTSSVFTINAQPLGGFNQSVNLSASANPAVGSISLGVSPGVLTPGATAALTVTVGANTPPGIYNITLSGSSGLLMRSRTVILNVTPPARPKPSITGALFNKPNLFINGAGFGTSGARIIVNDRDVSSFIAAQSNTQITLKGNKKKLNLLKGANRVTVIADGVASDVFSFSL